MSAKISVEDLSISFRKVPALRGVSLEVQAHEILAVIGPANSGKTSFLRTLNRLNDLNQEASVSGRVCLDGKDIYREFRPSQLRRRVGMVFALPTPLPGSVFENVTHGLRLAGVRSPSELARRVEESLSTAFLWDEVKDRLHQSAFKLSGGQQQRLCLARTLAIDPDVILYDEPCSGLDPLSTAKIEEAMVAMKEKYTQVLVTNNTKQAARVSDRTAFFLMGELVEVDSTEHIFTVPRDERTNDYVSGRFG